MYALQQGFVEIIRMVYGLGALSLLILYLIKLILADLLQIHFRIRVY